MNKFVNAINGMKTTENGAKAYSTTNSKVYDMFALGAAYRARSEYDCINLFENALCEDPLLALKCAAYIGDVRGGQGERRFRRVILNYLAKSHPSYVRKNINLIPEFGRWDDLYAFYGTPCWDDAVALIKSQLITDLNSAKVDCAPSLLAKWCKSENCHSKESRTLGTATRTALGLSSRDYRKMLSFLREKINIVERLMSEGRWNEIKYDKLPSKAGLIYKNAFAKHDAERYRAFATNKNTKVNAATLYPYEVVNKALNAHFETDIAMCDKYWENLPDYTGGIASNTLVMADVSGSMYSGSGSVRPIDMSIAMALYFADKQKGAFKNQFMTFESRPAFCTIHGKNIVDKTRNVFNANWGGSTNLIAAFDAILNVAVKNHVPAEDMPQNLMVVSDMEIDAATRWHGGTEIQHMKEKFANAGYAMPKLIFWNVNARNDTILDRADGTTCVSGCSPVIFEQILSGKSGIDVMMEKLNSERYSAIQI